MLQIDPQLVLDHYRKDLGHPRHFLIRLLVLAVTFPV